MVLAYHLIMSAYGFWLPNDPRGSWSDFVRSWELLIYGKAHKPATTQSVAHVPHDRELREHAKYALKYPPVNFDGLQARAIARGFATAAKEAPYTVHACAVMPDHVHLVIAKPASGRLIEKIASHLKAKASQRLNEEQIHPHAHYQRDAGKSPHSVWALKEWKCFLDSREDIARAIAYVEENPVKDGKKRQRWEFVQGVSG